MRTDLKTLYHPSLPLLFLCITFFLIYLAQLIYTIDNHFLIDDSFIYLRYTRNISQGFGFVWNPGEQPTEGFTSILYLLILVVFQKVNLPTIIVMPTISMLCSLFVLVMSWSLAGLLNPNHDTENFIAIVLIGLSPTFMFWNVSGMDIAFFSLLVIISVLVYINYMHKKYPAWLVGFIFALTSLARPEGIYLFIVTLLFDTFINHKRLISRDTLVILLVFSVIYVPIFVWNWKYFGYPLPNTYYAKTGDMSTIKFQLLGGIIYLSKSLAGLIVSLGIPLLLLLIEIRKVRWMNITSSKEITYILILIITSWGGIVVSGGDHFAWGRFLMPTIPLATLLVIVVCLPSVLENNKIKNNLLKIIAITTIAISVVYWQPWKFIFPEFKKTSLPAPNKNNLEYYPYWDSSFISMGKTLRAHIPENASIAVVPIGAIGYYSNMEVIDMVGIVDRVIAHEPLDPNYAKTWRPGHDKGDGHYILSREPDYIQLIDPLTSVPSPGLDEFAKQYKSKVEIWESPEFHTNYEFFPIKTEEGWYYNLYRRINSDK